MCEFKGIGSDVLLFGTLTIHFENGGIKPKTINRIVFSLIGPLVLAKLTVRAKYRGCDDLPDLKSPADLYSRGSNAG